MDSTLSGTVTVSNFSETQKNRVIERAMNQGHLPRTAIDNLRQNKATYGDFAALFDTLHEDIKGIAFIGIGETKVPDQPLNEEQYQHQLEKLALVKIAVVYIQRPNNSNAAYIGWLTSTNNGYEFATSQCFNNLLPGTVNVSESTVHDITNKVLIVDNERCAIVGILAAVVHARQKFEELQTECKNLTFTVARLRTERSDFLRRLDQAQLPPVAAGGSAAAATAATGTTDELQAEKRRAAVREETLKKHITDLQSQLRDARDEVQTLRQRTSNNNDVAGVNLALSNENADLKQQIDRLNQQFDDLHEELERAQTHGGGPTGGNGGGGSNNNNNGRRDEIYSNAIWVKYTRGTRTPVSETCSVATIQHMLIAAPGSNDITHQRDVESGLMQWQHAYGPQRIHSVDTKKITWQQMNFAAFADWYRYCASGPACRIHPDAWPESLLCRIGQRLLNALIAIRESISPGGVVRAEQRFKADNEEQVHDWNIDYSVKIGAQYNFENKKGGNNNKKNNNKKGGDRGGGGERSRGGAGRGGRGGGGGNAGAGRATSSDSKSH